MSNIVSDFEKNVGDRYPNLFRYQKLHAEVEAMKPAGILAVVGSFGAVLTGGDLNSNRLLISVAVVWAVRWGYIKWQQKKFDDLVYIELVRVTENKARDIDACGQDSN
ncbi:hypothetical protein [Pacificibacter marinus]|uniref:Uncharacterized protein n=1 Tax=Pacificibacter marinus TaxID=658057 RepID=A0A1Y5TGX3_9RHOB|nr:hypothetical protein [Pacificibacter marinus]SEL19223.1 hypothetical protein SAMN04488032_113106 [Pacificibacter marinus]SLN63936.1 hypothetical protein PAM7971_03342 [Pacificibacter marinus]